MGGASGVASSRARETGRGVTASSFSARTTARFRRSTFARRPSYSRYVVAAPSVRGVTRSLRPDAGSRAGASPTMTVVLVASSQTAHPDSSSPSGAAIAAGAPGIPTNGPRLALWIAEALTASGFAGVPAMSRAEARFSTGCTTSPIRTYSAPESRTMTICELPRVLGGRRNARMAHAATMITARMTPATNESDCARSGSSSIRTSPRTSACSIRRNRNRYPLTCSRVVDCRAMPPPGNHISVRRAALGSPNFVPIIPNRGSPR